VKSPERSTTTKTQKTDWSEIW